MIGNHIEEINMIIIKYKLRALAISNNLRRYKYHVISCSNRIGIPPEYIFGIMTIEQINRKGIWVMLENIIGTLFPGYLSKINASIGLCQIKPQTIKYMYPNLKNTDIEKLLLNKKNNINACGMLLKSYLDEIENLKFKETNQLLLLIKLYTSGSAYCPTYLWIFIYYKLYLWLINKRFE